MSKKLIKAVKSKADRLVEVEDGMRGGLGVFGVGLKIVHQEELWTEQFKSYEQYCTDVWGVGKKQAKRIEQSEEFKAKIAGTAEVPNRESHIREVLKAPEEYHIEILLTVQKHVKATGQKPTARDYRAAAKEFIPPEPVDVTEDPEEIEQEDTPSTGDWKLDRKRIIKTAQYLMRAIEDLNEVHPYPDVCRIEAVKCCQEIERYMEAIK